MKNFISSHHFQQITESEAKFIFEHGEKQLKDILDTNKDIVTRTTTLLVVSVTIIVTLIGYSITRWEKHHYWDSLLFSSVTGATYLFVAGLFILYNLLPKNYFTVGAEPKDFFSDRVFNTANKNYRLVAIYVNEINECQKRIVANKILNEKKWSNYKWAIRMLYFLPIILGIVYLIT
jgi:hypothetical protein